MLPMGLFKRRNFTFANLETFCMYGGLGAVGFFLTLFLQQVAGYSALQAGFAQMPPTLVMFFLSRRAGALADRFGPRLFMGIRPLIGATGIADDAAGRDFDYWTQLLPALLLFALGLVATVTPLTATVLADADESNAGMRRHQQRDRARGEPDDGRGAGRGRRCAVLLGARRAAREPDVAADQRRQAGDAGDGGGVPRCRRRRSPRSTSASARRRARGARRSLGLAGVRNPRRVHCADCAEGAHSIGAPHSPFGREAAPAAR
jgi:hypothetical protein